MSFLLAEHISLISISFNKKDNILGKPYDDIDVCERVLTHHENFARALRHIPITLDISSSRAAMFVIISR